MTSAKGVDDLINIDRSVIVYVHHCQTCRSSEKKTSNLNHIKNIPYLSPRR